jgi:hypothetical protein
MDLLVFFYNYTHEITSSTLRLLSCLPNSHGLTAFLLRLSHITLRLQTALSNSNSIDLIKCLSGLVWPPFLASGERNRDNRLQGFYLAYIRLLRSCYHGFASKKVTVTVHLASCCPVISVSLRLQYSGFQASCHNIYIFLLHFSELSCGFIYQRWINLQYFKVLHSMSLASFTSQKFARQPY